MTHLALLHGFAGSAGTFDGLRQHLGSAFTYETPALFGHGITTPLTRYEDEVARLATTIAAGSILVGYSFGGRLAMGLLAHAPARWRGAVLVGAHPGLTDAAVRATRRASDAAWSALLRRDGLGPFITAWEAQPLFASQADLPAAVRATQRDERRRLNAHHLADAMDHLGLAAMPCWTDALRHVTVPIRFVAGEHDPRYRALGADLATVIPTLRVDVATGAGHNVVLERPDLLAAVVRDLAGTP